MSISAAVDFDQSVEDRATRKASSLYVFDVCIEFSISLPKVHPEMQIAKTEGWQTVQFVAWRMNAVVSRTKRFAAVCQQRINIDPKLQRTMKWDAEMGKRQCKDHDVSPREARSE